MSYLEKMAYTDNLTKLSNRNAMNDYFKNILSEGIAKDHQFACIIIDLNNFKEINDNYGHLIGDEILSLIGTKLKVSCENTRHFLGRLGGDEFIVLARYQNLYEIEEIANKIYSAIVEVNYIGNNVLRVGCCMGISLFPENGVTQEILMKQADESLYKIKKKHMSGICFYSNSFV
jgi:diguanylate cyclase (GGDEF)-like protein